MVGLVEWRVTIWGPCYTTSKEVRKDGERDFQNLIQRLDGTHHKDRSRGNRWGSCTSLWTSDFLFWVGRGLSLCVSRECG